MEVRFISLVPRHLKRKLQNPVVIESRICVTTDHFIVVCLVTRDLNGSEAGSDLCFDTDLTAFVVKIKLFLY